MDKTLESEIDALSESERELLRATLEGEVPEEALWEADYEEKPASITKFFEDPYYLGSSMYPDGRRILYEPWWDITADIYAPHRRVHTVCFSGALSIGKSFVAAGIQAYELYLLACLRQPQRFYGLAPGSPIVLGFFSVFKYKVQQTIWGYLRHFVDSSPFFTERFCREDLKRDLKFPKAIQAIPGAEAIHAIGENVISATIDEVEFMKGGATEQEKGQAYELHRAVQRRREGRFLREGLQLPGKNVLVSSKRYVDSYTEVFIREHQEDPLVHISELALWDAKPGKYSKKTFPVVVGNGIDYETYILPEGQDPPEDARVEEVPETFRSSFEEAPDDALADFAGVAGHATHRFVAHQKSVYACCRKEVPFLFTKEEAVLDFRKPDVALDPLFRKDLALEVRSSKYRPRVNPSAPRYIHVDLAITKDCAGISMAHPFGTRQVNREDPDGNFSAEVAPIIYFDFMLRVRPPGKGSQIDLAKIRRFILALQSWGYPLRKVTFDGYQSIDSRQLLLKQGINADIRSIDKVDQKSKQCVPYTYLRSACYEERVMMALYQPFIDEFLHLTEDTKTRKVDHPQFVFLKGGKRKRGAKDVSDSAAGCVAAIMEDESVISQLKLVADLPPVRKRLADPTMGDWLLDDYKPDRKIVRIR